MTCLFTAAQICLSFFSETAERAGQRSRPPEDPVGTLLAEVVRRSHCCNFSDLDKRQIQQNAIALGNLKSDFHVREATLSEILQHR